MEVTKTNHDEVSGVLTVTLAQSDYKEKVDKTLKNYAKTATVPGFRKGKVPMSMLRRQYEAGVAYEEINKQVNDALNKYITDNKIRLVGQPIPQASDDVDYKKESLSVSFEIGYEPEFSIDLSKYEAPHFKVEAGDKEVNQSIENMQKRFAERDAQEIIADDSYVALSIEQVVEPVEGEEEEHHHHHAPKNVTINKENKAAFDLVKNLKVGENVDLKKADLVSNEELLKALSYTKEEAENLHHDDLKVTVSEIYKLNLAELNKDLFDKVYGKDEIENEEALRARVKEELDEYFQQNADVLFVNKVLEDIIEKEDIQLPEAFLIKWLMFNNSTIESEDKAKEILENEKRDIKHQIIEGKLMSENNISIDYNEILSQAEQNVRNQLAMYGIYHLSDEEIQNYAVETLKNEEQVRQVSSAVAMSKLKDVILEKATKKEQEISHDDFLKELEK